MSDNISFFKNVLTYPFTGLLNAFFYVLTGMSSFLIFPMLLNFGYNYEIIESTLNGEKHLPDFKNGKKLLKNGLKMVGAVLCLYLPLLLINIILNQITANFTITTIIYLAINLIIIPFYVLMIGNMVRENRFTALFQVKKVPKFLKNIGYKKYITYLLTFNIITAIPAGILFILNPDTIIALTLIGIPTFTIYLCYICLAGARFAGLITQKATQK